jgi:probable HAF family extracellular repeat protein
MVDLGGFGGTCTAANDLNNQGQVVGFSTVAGDAYQRAFMWEHGSIHDLGGSLGGNNTGAFVMNEEGKAVGFATLPGEAIFHATFWRHVGNMADLGTVGNDQCSFATGINAEGQIVGGSKPDCSTDPTRAFLWEDGSIFDLNALIPPGSPLYLQSTYTINDRGEIAGEGVDTSGNGHAILLVPCDEQHPDVDGCDYSLVDASAAAEIRSAHPARLSEWPQIVNPGTLMRRMPRLRLGPLSRTPTPAPAEGESSTSPGSACTTDNGTVNDLLTDMSPRPATAELTRQSSCHGVRCGTCGACINHVRYCHLNHPLTCNCNCCQKFSC